MDKITQIRQTYPEYDALNDEELVKSLHASYSPNEPLKDFSKKMGLEISLTSPVKRFAKGLASDIENIIPNVLKGSEVINKYIKKGTNFLLNEQGEQEYLDYNKKINLTESEQKKWSSKIGGAFGSSIKYAGLAMTGVGLAGMGTEIFGSVYNDIEQTHPEWGDNKKFVYSATRALPEALLERWGTSQLLDPVLKTGKVGLKNLLVKGSFFKGLKSMLFTGAKEGSQEASQQVVGNVIDKVYGLDTNLGDGIVESFFIGGLVGSAWGVAPSFINERVIQKNYEELSKVLTETEIVELKQVMDSAIEKQIVDDENGLKEAVNAIADSDIMDTEITKKLIDKLQGKGASVEDIQEIIDNTEISDQEDIVKRAEAQEQADPLMAEARKYDSAEEFIENNTNFNIKSKVENLNNPFSKATNFILTDSTNKESVLQVSIEELENKILLPSIAVKDINDLSKNISGTKMGTEFIKNLKDYADLSGKEFIVQGATKTAKTFWDKFNFLTPAYDGNNLNYIYLPKKQITEIYNKAQETQIKKEQQQDKFKVFQQTMDNVKITKEIMLSSLGYGKQTAERRTVKQVQTELTNYIKGLELEAKDKAKFLSTIKEAQTEKSLARVIRQVANRATKLQEAQAKREYKIQIDNELKSTKDIKSGAKKIGRYDYETNKLFTDLKKYNKLTQEYALNEQNNLVQENEIPDTYTRIKISFLEYKINGMDSSASLMKQVYDDITLSKALGENAKDEADFEAKINRLTERTKISQAMSDNKTQGNKILAGIGKLYAGGFGNIYSILSTITNANIAKEYNLEKIESDRMVGVFFAKQQMIEDAGKSLDLTPKQTKKYLEDMTKEKFEVIRNDGIVSEWDKTQLLHMYLGIKNDKVREAYNKYFGSEDLKNVKINLLGEEYEVSSQVADLLNNLSEKDLDMADAIQDIVQSYRDSNNEVHVRQTGKDLKMVDNYFPMTSEHQAEIVDSVPIASEFASFQNERKGMAIPEPSNFWAIAENHIEQSEQLKNVTERYIEVKKIFNSNQVLELNDGTKTTIKKFIEDRYGKDMVKVINQAFDRSSMNRMVAERNMIDGIVGIGLNNWIKSKISLNPNVFVKQLISVNNYTEDMPIIEWTKGFTEGMLHPKETFDYMWNNSPYLRARYGNGYNEQLSRLMKQSSSFSQLSEWSNALTFLTKMGDMGAIVYGGYPLLKAKGEVAFREATMRSQQSGLGASISGLQASKNPFTRMFTAFKNTPQQYLRKIVDAQFQFANGDISAEQYVKTVSIYAVIQPAMFGFVGGIIPYALGGGDDDTFWEYSLKNMVRNIILSPLLGIVLLGDVASSAYARLSGDRLYDVFNISMLNDIERAIKKLAKKKITLSEVLLIMGGTVGDIGLGIPATQGERYVDKISKLMKKSK